MCISRPTHTATRESSGLKAQYPTVPSVVPITRPLIFSPGKFLFIYLFIFLLLKRISDLWQWVWLCIKLLPVFKIHYIFSLSIATLYFIYYKIFKELVFIFSINKKNFVNRAVLLFLHLYLCPYFVWPGWDSTQWRSHLLTIQAALVWNSCPGPRLSIFCCDRLAQGAEMVEKSALKSLLIFKCLLLLY